MRFKKKNVIQVPWLVSDVLTGCAISHERGKKKVNWQRSSEILRYSGGFCILSALTQVMVPECGRHASFSN